jgi:hypothetical protein
VQVHVTVVQNAVRRVAVVEVIMLNWELLNRARELVNGIGGDEPDPVAAVERIIEYLVRRDCKQLYEEICSQIDTAQKNKVKPEYMANLLLERDKCLALITDFVKVCS